MKLRQNRAKSCSAVAWSPVCADKDNRGSPEWVQVHTQERAQNGKQSEHGGRERGPAERNVSGKVKGKDKP